MDVCSLHCGRVARWWQPLPDCWPTLVCYDSVTPVLVPDG